MQQRKQNERTQHTKAKKRRKSLRGKVAGKEVGQRGCFGDFEAIPAAFPAAIVDAHAAPHAAPLTPTPTSLMMSMTSDSHASHNLSLPNFKERALVAEEREQKKKKEGKKGKDVRVFLLLSVHAKIVDTIVVGTYHMVAAASRECPNRWQAEQKKTSRATRHNDALDVIWIRNFSLARKGRSVPQLSSARGHAHRFCSCSGSAAGACTCSRGCGDLHRQGARTRAATFLSNTIRSINLYSTNHCNAINEHH